MTDTTPTPLAHEPQHIDIADQLRYVMGDTGGLQDVMSGFRIAVYHTRAFPWDEVFKLLLYRDFKVYVTRKKADLFIEVST